MREDTKQNEHACGPEEDAEFFADIQKVMQKHPHLEGKYRIACADHETDIMKVDFGEQAALKRIVGDTVVIEFKPRAEVESQSSTCCEWFCPIGKPCYCISWWV